MDLQEFYEEIRNLCEALDNYCKERDSFTADLSLKLCNYATHLYPQLLENEESLNQIKDESDILSLMAFEYYCDSTDTDDSILFQKTESYIPKITTLAESEVELQEFLSFIPQSKHAYAKQIHWDEYEQEIKRQKLRKDAHDLVKSVLIAHFEEEITEFNSSEFHYLNNITWLCVARPFLNKVYELVP
ncbi:hypothetical protein [Saccharicrinis aurantiacus]|uniref:hypothetical protein n=1 Tax=Saccharicrinis aurantiacus TaxID=1849719 RepID=UPI0024909E57|nr:hypothetical protein [Saccharicrinis aurantiacus]